MPRRRLLVLASASAVAAFALLAAGCGGRSSPGVANVASSATTTTSSSSSNALVAFSTCMRSNGMPTFPDPQHFVGGNVKLTIHQIESSNPHFRSALSACDHLLPSHGEPSDTTQSCTQRADALSFARCMRSHGVSRFPDPTAQGELSVEMVEAQGIDVHSSAVLRVVQKCLPASHGGLTAAKVREAIANAK